jgi:hypothetical protein
MGYTVKLSIPELSLEKTMYNFDLESLTIKFGEQEFEINEALVRVIWDKLSETKLDVLVESLTDPFSELIGAIIAKIAELDPL